MRRSTPYLLLVTAGLLAHNVSAQVPPVAPPPPAVTPAGPTAEQFQSLNEKVERLEGQLTTERAERLAEAEDVQAVLEGQSVERQTTEAAGEALPSARFFGFMDLSFNRFFFAEDSPWNAYLTPKSTFLMTDVNLYFASQMTENLAALVELDFMFMPIGQDMSYAEAIETTNPDGSTTVMKVPGATYERRYVENKARDPFTGTGVTFGSVWIERAELTYAPRNWFKVTAGRFLTPYGIWNVDHGSTVVLMARVPYMYQLRMVEEAQTGLMVSGRFFPAAGLYLDYAVTLSNGYGPVTEVYDLDENKAIGLKLKLTYDRPPARVALGGYFMYSSWANNSKTVVVNPTTEKTRIELTAFDCTDELIGTLDLKLELFGVLLQSEFIQRYTLYKDPGKLGLDNPDRVLQIKDFNPQHQYYWASSSGWALYFLAGWELPLSRYLHDVRITPFVYAEGARPNDTKPHWGMNILMAGINVKPSRFVALKLEYGYFLPADELYGGSMHDVAAQVAVSF